eukprot:366572-Chlamydomonas_euryale.AAC.4
MEDVPTRCTRAHSGAVFPCGHKFDVKRFCQVWPVACPHSTLHAPAIARGIPTRPAGCIGREGVGAPHAAAMQSPFAGACASLLPPSPPSRASCCAAGARRLLEACHGRAHAARCVPQRRSRPCFHADLRRTFVAATAAANATAAAAGARPPRGRLPRPLNRGGASAVGAIATRHAAAASASLLPPSQRVRAHPAGPRSASEAAEAGAGAARRRVVVAEGTGGGGSGGRGGPGADEEAGELAHATFCMASAWSSLQQLQLRLSLARGHAS